MTTLTNTTTTQTIWVCVDCHLTHHGVREDDTPLDHEPMSEINNDDSIVEVTSGMGLEDHDCVNAVDVDPWVGRVECDCEHRDFVTSACQGCGSPLAGDRHALTIWIKED